MIQLVRAQYQASTAAQILLLVTDIRCRAIMMKQPNVYTSFNNHEFHGLPEACGYMLVP